VNPVNISRPVTATVTRLPGTGLANFFALRGRRVYRACGVFWYSVPGRFLMNLPYQQALDPSRKELRDLLLSSRAAGVRFLSDRWPGLAGGVYIRRKGSYDLNAVHYKHRPRVRKGLETFEIRPVEKKELLDQALEANRGTMARQGRYDPEFAEVEPWRRLVKAMGSCPEVSAIGAFKGRQLSAYMIVCKEDHWLHILHQMSHWDRLKSFPNHALTYYVTKAASEDPSLEGVCYGLVSLVANEGLHEYKLRFGYDLIRRTCAFVLNPGLDPLLNNRVVHWGVQRLRKLRPEDQRLEMMDTVLRGAALTSRDAITEKCRSRT